MRKPAYFNAKVDGVPAYDTKDLVIFHPDHPKYFKLIGRADDQITHSTGVSLSIHIKSECVVKSLILHSHSRKRYANLNLFMCDAF
jgi:hypothetical protein